MNFYKILPYYKIFLSGLKLTVVITVVSVALALVIALALYALQSAKWKPCGWFVKGYVLLIRSTPLLLLLFICHFGSVLRLFPRSAWRNYSTPDIIRCRRRLKHLRR